MEYRTLGKTGLRVSALGFGSSPLGGVFGTIDEAEGVRAVHLAHDLGVNYFDVAPMYGETRAETVLGRALATLPREKFILSTKVGRYGWQEFDFSAERVVRSIEESLQRLQVEYIDLIVCHDIEYVPLAPVIQEAIPALRRLQAQGKVRYLGASGLPLAIYPDILAQTDLDFLLSYCHYSLNDTSLETLFPLVQERGLGLISASPLMMGLLTESGPPPWHPAPDAIQAACAAAVAHCRQQGASIAQLALSFALANPQIHSVLVGMKDTKTVRQNLAWATTTPDPTLLAQVQEILRPIRNQTWASGRYPAR